MAGVSLYELEDWSLLKTAVVHYLLIICSFTVIGGYLNWFSFTFNDIADGESHVFADRVYLFGSHDKENGLKVSGNTIELATFKFGSKEDANTIIFSNDASAFNAAMDNTTHTYSSSDYLYKVIDFLSSN